MHYHNFLILFKFTSLVWQLKKQKFIFYLFHLQNTKYYVIATKGDTFDLAFS